MPFYFRNISYINSYDGEHCIGNLGHVKWLVRDGICSIRVIPVPGERPSQSIC